MKFERIRSGFYTHLFRDKERKNKIRTGNDSADKNSFEQILITRPLVFKTMMFTTLDTMEMNYYNLLINYIERNIGINFYWHKLRETVYGIGYIYSHVGFIISGVLLIYTLFYVHENSKVTRIIRNLWQDKILSNLCRKLWRGNFFT